MKTFRSHTKPWAEWKRYIAILLSLLYLANPLYQPISIVLHETIAFFESPNSVMGHQVDFYGIVNDFEVHEHEKMELEYGHELIELLESVLEKSEEKKSSDGSIAENLKIDKHLVYTDFAIPLSTSENEAEYFYQVDKSMIGHPFEIEAPPKPM